MPLCRSISPCATLIVLLFLCAASAHCQHQFRFHSIHTDPASGVKLEVTSPFQFAPNAGTLPVLVDIKNNSGRTRRWLFEFSNASGGIKHANYSTYVTVEDGAQRKVELVVPLYSYSSYANITLLVSGYGITGQQGSMAGGYSNYGREAAPFAGFSGGIGHSEFKEVEELYKTNGASFAGTMLDAHALPSEWRGYDGLDVLFLTSAEWNALSAMQQQAQRSWIVAGGTLVVCNSREAALRIGDFHDPDVLGEIDPGRTDYHMGLGRLIVLDCDQNGMSGGQTGDITRTRDIINDSRRMPARSTEAQRSSVWEAAKQIPPIENRIGLIILVLVVYGIAVGPVNIKLLAGEERRARLFLTTPVMALVTCVILALLIVLQDGFGGWGYRTLLVFLSAEDKRLFVAQEQISRSGMLFNQSFDVNEPILLDTLQFVRDEQNQSLTSPYGVNMANQMLQINQFDNSYSGDLFQSRKIQAQYLRSVQPSRSKITLLNRAEVAAGREQPRIESTVNLTLEDLFYVDQERRIWRGQSVRAGTPAGLSPSSEAALVHWFTEQRSHSGPNISALLNRMEQRRNFFYAASSSADLAALATLSSISWRDTKAIIAGEIH